MATPDSVPVAVTAKDRMILGQAFECYISTLKRRVNGEVNQAIKEILQAQLRETEALAGRF